MSTETQAQTASDGQVNGDKQSLTVTDNRTGKTYDVPIEDGTVRAMAFREMKVSDDDFGLMTYDPAYTKHASCRSAITFLDGEAGVLEYRGYPIEQLAEEVDIPRGRLPPGQRRAPHPAAARRVEARDHDPHLRPRERQDVHAGLPPRRSPDGHAARVGRRALDILPRRQTTSRIRTTATSRRSGSSPRCRPSPPSPSATPTASPTSIRTTNSSTRATSSTCSTR